MKSLKFLNTLKFKLSINRIMNNNKVKETFGIIMSYKSIGKH